MKKSRFGRFFGVLTALLWITAVAIIPLTTGEAEVTEYTVVVDAGHGGTDGGAVAEDGTLEKDLNLSIALRLQKKLEERGVRVIMTRTEDDDTDGLSGFHKRKDLEARTKIGNESGAQAYVSIHINASKSYKDQGFQVWYGTGSDKSESLATPICNRVRNAEICSRIRAVKKVPNTLYIFRSVTVPSVLIECGFLSNATDLYRLKQESFQNALCDALCDGILDYLSGIKAETIPSETKNPSAVNENR